MSEELAEQLKWLVRAYVVGVVVYLAQGHARGLKNQPGVVFVVSLIVAAWLFAYLSFFLGVDVAGLARIFGVPRGHRFTGFAPGEEVRLRLNFTYGAINRAGYNGVFKLVLTDRRLLAGANLTRWFLVEIPLREIVRATLEPRRWFLPAAVVIVQSGGTGVFTWKIGLASGNHFSELLAELGRLGVEVEGSPEIASQSIPRL